MTEKRNTTGAEPPSRRRFLQSGVAVAATLGTAGCAGVGGLVGRDGGDSGSAGDTGGSAGSDSGSDGSGNNLRSISYGDTEESVVERDDGRDPEYSDVAEPVEFEAEAGDVVTVSMVSATFDAYLVLADPAGGVVAEDDDSAGGRDSRIERTLTKSGTYTIWAGSYEGDATGSYTLTLSKTGERSVSTESDSDGSGDLRSISYGQTKSGYVDQGDGRDPVYSDIAEPVEFEAQAGDQVSIVMESSALDAYLVLADPSGSGVADDDDSQGGTDSRIETTLSESGTYTIWAGSYDGNAIGSYTLSLRTL